MPHVLDVMVLAIQIVLNAQADTINTTDHVLEHAPLDILLILQLSHVMHVKFSVQHVREQVRHALLVHQIEKQHLCVHVLMAIMRLRVDVKNAVHVVLHAVDQIQTAHHAHRLEPPLLHVTVRVVTLKTLLL